MPAARALTMNLKLIVTDTLYPGLVLVYALWVAMDVVFATSSTGKPTVT